jgi:pimeloyl-ACP methyl ester carboxylesterase
MSAITIGGDLVHYEKLGRGRPVILIHGWIGSWRYWIPVMSKLHTKYSVYTLDLIGFGDSAKNERSYSVLAQVKMLEQFLDQLGIPKVAIIAHGLGAMVATQFALRHPDKAVRMLLTSMPLFDPGNLDERTPAGTRKLLTSNTNRREALSPSVEEVMGDDTIPSSANREDGNGTHTPFHELPTIGRPDNIDREKLKQAAAERDAKTQNRPNPLLEALKDETMTSLLDKCFKRSEPEYDKLKTDVDKSDNRVLTRSAEGYDAGTMLDDLRRVTAPIVAVHGEQDRVVGDVPSSVWDYLTLQQEDVFVPIVLPVRHFPMLETEVYVQLATDFLDTSDISKIEIRERWRRRSR